MKSIHIFNVILQFKTVGFYPFLSEFRRTVPYRIIPDRNKPSIVQKNTEKRDFFYQNDCRFYRLFSQLRESYRKIKSDHHMHKIVLLANF
jgi:hypothetical protein